MLKVFISYRRDETAGICGRLHDELGHRFGQESVFRDVNSIPAGVEFREDIRRAVTECDELVVLIGYRWVAADETGRRRLDEPSDYVHLEISLALECDRTVIPVLVGQAPMPRREDLPDDLADLVHRNAVRLDHGTDVLPHMDRLIREIEQAALRTSAAPISNTVFRIGRDRQNRNGALPALEVHPGKPVEAASDRDAPRRDESQGGALPLSSRDTGAGSNRRVGRRATQSDWSILFFS